MVFPQRYIDQGAFNVIGRALDASTEPMNEMKTTDDMIKLAAKIARAMEDENTRIAESIQLREFCVNLGTSLLSYRSSLQEYGQIHTNRR